MTTPAWADTKFEHRLPDVILERMTTVSGEAGTSADATLTQNADGTTQGTLGAQATGHVFAGVSQDYGLSSATIDASGSLGMGTQGLQGQARVRGTAGIYLLGGISGEAGHRSVGSYSENTARIGWTPTLMGSIGQKSYLIIQPQLLGVSYTQITDHRGTRNVTLGSKGAEVTVKTPKFTVNARGYRDSGNEGKRLELGLSGKYTIGTLVGQKTYVGAELSSVTTKDAKYGDRLLLEPALESNVQTATATAGFAF
jgi:hypothetical protein